MTNSALKKRTQKSRSNDTINKILTATTDTIYEVGFHNTTTSRIALKAGVSRGALLHHFPRKEILIAEAVRFMLRNEIEEIERLAENVQNDRLSIDEFLDILWEHFSGPLFMTTMDYLAASRTEPLLKQELTPSSLEFNQSLDKIWQCFFATKSIADEQKRLAFTTTICLLRGMAVNSILRDDPDYFRNLLDFWKKELASILKSRSGNCDQGI